MARTGVPAFDSGMRGREAPSEKARRKVKKGKRDVKRVSIERATTGHIVEVERHQPKPKIQDGVSSPVTYEPPERHAHSDPDEAKAHVAQLMDEMAPPEDNDGD